MKLCPDNTCQPLSSMETKGGGVCIGKPKDVAYHNGVANPMRECWDVGELRQFRVNQADLIVEVYVIGEALRSVGLALPASIVNNLPIEEDLT